MGPIELCPSGVLGGPRSFSGPGSECRFVSASMGLEFQDALLSMGETHILGVCKDIRRALAKYVGDVLRVAVARDSGEGRLQVSEDLESVLRNAPVHQTPGSEPLMTMDKSLSYTHQQNPLSGSMARSVISPASAG